MGKFTIKNLNSTERLVIGNLAKGSSAGEVADTLGLSLAMIRYHCNACYRKAGVKSLVALLYELGKIDIKGFGLPEFDTQLVESLEAEVSRRGGSWVVAECSGFFDKRPSEILRAINDSKKLSLNKKGDKVIYVG
jgi:DNA-binding CsgD family transcriptional regulator